MTLKPGDSAPDFELPLLPKIAAVDDAEQPAEFRRLLDLLIQGPALLAFVKESCPTCQYALPFVDRIYRNYPESKVSLVVIAQEDGSMARKMVEGWGIQMPVLLDEEPFAVSQQYDLSFVPTFFYVTQEGEVETVVESFAREELRVMNEKIAQFSGLHPIPFFKPEEDVPPFRPG